MQVVRRPLFLDDLAEAYSYLADRDRNVADSFFDEVEALIALIAAFPDIGREREELGENVRSFRVRRFRHLLFYRREANAVTLLRILHAARDIRPGSV